MIESLKLAAKTDEEKLETFKERLIALYACKEDELDCILKPRPADPLMIGYDKTQTYFAITFDGEVWKKNTIVDYDIYSAVTIPPRGSVWKSISSMQFFVVIDFANLRSTNSKEEPPYIVYMDGNGNTKTMHVIKWFAQMVSYNKKITKRK
jgi:hypothetical protein